MGPKQKTHKNLCWAQIKSVVLAEQMTIVDELRHSCKRCSNIMEVPGLSVCLSFSVRGPQIPK